MKKTLEQRLSGDALLNARDLIIDIKNAGGFVDEYGYATVYHRTSKGNASNIIKTGIMMAKEDGLFFSTKENGVYNQGYGDSVIKVAIPVEKLHIDDIFNDEIHLRYSLNKTRALDVSEYLINNDKKEPGCKNFCNGFPYECSDACEHEL